MTSNKNIFVSRKGEQFVDFGSYGSPPNSLPSNEASMRVRFYNFADLPHTVGASVESTTMEALNHKWKLMIFPGGNNQENADVVSCFLFSVGKKLVECDFKFEVFNYSESESRDFRKSFRKRKHVLSNYLDEAGTLIVDVHIHLKKMESPLVWRTKPKDFKAFGQKMLESSVGSDVSFVVGTDQEKITAHQMVLSVQAPGLFEFIKEMAQHDELEISDVSCPTFKILLHHIYTCELPKVDSGPIAKELLILADRFSCTLLKLHVESEVVSKLLKPSNAAEWLLLADGHSCPLLKEACMDLYIGNQAEMIASSGWSKVKESFKLVVELLEYPVTAKSRTPNDSQDFDNLPVRILLEKLEDNGLDLDGTREMLIQRLKERHSGGN